MRGIVLGLALAVAATGCASTDELKQKAPVAEFTSGKAPAEVAECINYAWGNVEFGGAPFPAQMRKVGDTYAITTNAAAVLELAEVTPSPEGSRVTLRQSNVSSGIRLRKYKPAIEACL